MSGISTYQITDKEGRIVFKCVTQPLYYQESVDKDTTLSFTHKLSFQNESEYDWMVVAVPECESSVPE